MRRARILSRITESSQESRRDSSCGAALLSDDVLGWDVQLQGLRVSLDEGVGCEHGLVDVEGT